MLVLYNIAIYHLQCDQVENCQSNWINSISGVPQGSVVGLMIGDGS